MIQRPFIFDCDGVLLDWETGFREWLAKAHPEYVLKTKFPDNWDLQYWIGCDKEKAAFLITKFNHSEAFGNLRAMPYAQRVIYEISTMGHPIFVVTSCSGDKEVLSRRRHNLAMEFGSSFENVICLPLGMSKMDTLKAFHTVFGSCVWIEDNYQNAAHGFAAGHQSHFLHRPHNISYQMLRDRDGKDINHLEKLIDLVSLYK